MTKKLVNDKESVCPGRDKYVKEQKIIKLMFWIELQEDQDNDTKFVAATMKVFWINGK